MMKPIALFCIAVFIVSVSLSSSAQTPAAPAPRAAAVACSDPAAHPEYHQLDFWVGDWNVYKDDQKIAEVHVEKVLSGCGVSELWKGTHGDGMGMSTYNQKSKQWEYFWVSDKGATSHFSGSLLPGEMRYRMTVPQPDGGVRLRHWSLIQLPQGKVRELSVGTNDDGVSWTTEYDYTWAPKTN